MIQSAFYVLMALSTGGKSKAELLSLHTCLDDALDAVTDALENAECERTAI